MGVIERGLALLGSGIGRKTPFKYMEARWLDLRRKGRVSRGFLNVHAIPIVRIRSIRRPPNSAAPRLGTPSIGQLIHSEMLAAHRLGAPASRGNGDRRRGAMSRSSVRAATN
jgi:hypothetical protein